ncbi:hypothetical protein [Flavobacterium flavigenum]|uniref:hypothetical protein n=1 Tax=Flavobacterium flavigenum TaxID=3003258 RepID=UPI0022ABE46C|nr:hypothetical protein [Flavobacterium flavigenum]
MKRTHYTCFFKVNFKDRYDEFWLREDLEAISSSLKYEFIEDLEIIRISNCMLYSCEINTILDYYNLEYVVYYDLEDQKAEHSLQ